MFQQTPRNERLTPKGKGSTMDWTAGGNTYWHLHQHCASALPPPHDHYTTCPLHCQPSPGHQMRRLRSGHSPRFGARWVQISSSSIRQSHAHSARCAQRPVNGRPQSRKGNLVLTAEGISLARPSRTLSRACASVGRMTVSLTASYR